MKIWFSKWRPVVIVFFCSLPHFLLPCPLSVAFSLQPLISRMSAFCYCNTYLGYSRKSRRGEQQKGSRPCWFLTHPITAMRIDDLFTICNCWVLCNLHIFMCAFLYFRFVFFVHYISQCVINTESCYWKLEIDVRCAKRVSFISWLVCECVCVCVFFVTSPTAIWIRLKFSTYLCDKWLW